MHSIPSQQRAEGLNPKPLLDLNYAFAQTAILIAAVRLRLFTLIDEQSLTVGELAAAAGTEPEATRRLLRGLITLGLVEQEAERYRLTAPALHFLVEGKSSYLGGDTLAMLDYIPAWLALDQTVQSAHPYRDLGSPATAETFFAPRVRDLFPLIYPIARRAIPLLVSAVERERPLQILDLGAGCAPWSIALVQQFPSAQVTAIDLPTVARQGQRYTEELGLTDRFRWREADIEQIEYEPADIVFLGHVSRFISDERTQALLHKASRCLQPGGKLLLADVFFREEGESTLNATAVMLDLSMLVNSAGGRIRTCTEIEAWLKQSGFVHVQRVDSIAPFPVFLAQKEGI
ncbi:methyltransferase family protein [Thermosporothrix hazakensis]|uniref:Methyltransferase family protein n=1 Tax=Thermosporothrix hazakensis TaxID=644383 RepID=A0A326U3V4_THEHA|nr:class I SAM-dependent methyltransferase [Thermosporothrix hazakensis]PZW18314.1 methyltransferase family protein [Thermosporothrix hazakensis]GCE51440.1 hypothetical protein KTH_63090 [Thermosporothrix hazakensis]